MHAYKIEPLKFIKPNTPPITNSVASPIQKRTFGKRSASIPHTGVTNRPTNAGVERKREKYARFLDSNSLVKYGPMAPKRPSKTKYDVDIALRGFIKKDKTWQSRPSRKG